MSNRHHSEAANALIAAHRSGVAIPPVNSETAPLTIEDAYAIQQLQVDQWRLEGRQVVGHKVGLTSRAIQKQLGVDRPDFGHLFADMFHPSDAPIPLGTYIQPRIEPEIAFVLSRDLKGPGVTVAEAIVSIDYVIASMEIIDSRISDWKITLADTIADNASCGGVVLGTRPRPLMEVDVQRIGVNLFRNGVLEQSGTGAAVLGSPINALVWLANTLGELGTTLTAGSVILPGAVCAAIPALPGDSVTAEFAGLGAINIQFAPHA